MSPINFTWADTNSTESSHEIWRKDGGGAFALLATVGPNVQQYYDTAVNAGTIYTYKVRAIRGATLGPFSAEVALTPVSSDTIPMSVIFWQRIARENSNNATVARIGSAEDDTQSGAALTWYPTFGLYGHHKTIAAGAIDSLTFNIGVLPASWLDPREIERPYVYRVRDVVATGWTGLTRGRCVFLMGSKSRSGANYCNSIGFHNNGTGNWYSYLSAMDRSVLRNVDLGRTTDTPRELMFELNGRTREARWYIDGVLLDSFVMGQDNTTPIFLNGYYVELFHEVAGIVADASTNTIYTGLGMGLMIELEEI